MVGLEYNPSVQELVPTLNYTLQFEEHEGSKPLITFGTSSDRIFSPEGTRSYFVTFGKGIPKYKMAPYLSLNYSEWERTITIPFGLNVAIAAQWDAMVQHDGRNTHWLLTRKGKSHNISLLLVKGRHFGISTGVKF